MVFLTGSIDYFAFKLRIFEILCGKLSQAQEKLCDEGINKSMSFLHPDMKEEDI